MKQIEKTSQNGRGNTSEFPSLGSVSNSSSVYFVDQHVLVVLN